MLFIDEQINVQIIILLPKFSIHRIDAKSFLPFSGFCTMILQLKYSA